MLRGDFVVRAATKGDWRKLRDLRLESLLDTPEAYGSTYEESIRRSAAQWKQMAKNFNYFVAERDLELTGMASGGLNERFPGTAWLYGMYVTPEERGTTMAAALVERVARWALEAGYAELYLDVGERVARARAFYLREGFVDTGARHALTRDSSLELLTMRRALRRG
ncbi:MAG TPA: GNAT family N-acetyltransferase [Acidimicrobiales bacterium]|nr:GNAT family N-acetyltransferase [Acidimicrobiales bacterium]